MFDIGAGEFIFIVVLAVVLLGPEKIPDYARKAARILHWLRNIANNATTSIKSELGPEYQNLSLEDLNPKTFIQKHLLADIQEELDEVKATFNDVKGVLESTKADTESLSADLKNSVEQATRSINEVQKKVDAAKTAADLDGRPPFDDEAT